VLAGNGRSLLNRALGETLFPFQVEFLTFSSALSANWPNVSSQRCSS
jgi:hypothetical protein